MFDEFNPIGAVFGLGGGMLGLFVSKGMEASIGMKIMIFVACAVAGYMLSSKMFE